MFRVPIARSPSCVQMYRVMYTCAMTQYSIADARKHLPEIIDEALAGGAVRLTRRGREVAVLVSVSEYDRLRQGRRNFSETYAAFRKRFPEGSGIEPEYWRTIRSADTGRKIEL